MYIHELPNWPRFQFDPSALSQKLKEVGALKQRLLLGMAAIGFKIQNETLLKILTQDVIKTSEIEGELLDKESVRSSIARHLGVETGAINTKDRLVDGIVEMILDATQNFNNELSKERLLEWQSRLFPSGRSGYKKIKTGDWRSVSVDVISEE